MSITSDAILQGVRAMPITEALFSLKAEGRHPTARVVVDPGSGDVLSVVLNIAGVRYYFHSTKDKDGNRLETRQDENVWEVPFDGWEASPLDIAPMN